jgi:hypothetical protein
MVVEVLKQVLVLDQSLIQPGTFLWGQAFESILHG